MKAVVIHAYGGPDQLKFEELPDPIAGPGYVLVRVAATSVNPFDIKLRSGQMKAFWPLTFPAILGLDVSGVIQGIGPGVAGFSVGDNVFANAMQTYASLCVVKAADLARVPDPMDIIEIAALPTVTITGAQLAELATGGKRGGTVLVTGALGNVGRSAVFAAKTVGGSSLAASGKNRWKRPSCGGRSLVALDDGSLDSIGRWTQSPTIFQALSRIN